MDFLLMKYVRKSGFVFVFVFSQPKFALPPRVVLTRLSRIM